MKQAFETVTTVIKSNGDNNVFHNVFIEGDTIIAEKVIEGRIVQTYDWSYMTREELLDVIKTSGHNDYTLYEKKPVEVFVSVAQLKKDIKLAVKGAEGSLELEVTATDFEVAEGHDITVTVLEDGEIIYNETVENRKGDYKTRLAQLKFMLKALV